MLHRLPTVSRRMLLGVLSYRLALFRLEELCSTNPNLRLRVIEDSLRVPELEDSESPMMAEIDAFLDGSPIRFDSRLLAQRLALAHLKMRLTDPDDACNQSCALVAEVAKVALAGLVGDHFGALAGLTPFDRRLLRPTDGIEIAQGIEHRLAQTHNYSNLSSQFFPNFFFPAVRELFRDVIRRPSFLKQTFDGQVYEGVLNFRDSSGDQAAVDALLAICRPLLSVSPIAQTIFAVIHLLNQTASPDRPLGVRVLLSAIDRHEPRALLVALFLSVIGEGFDFEKETLWRLLLANRTRFHPALVGALRSLLFEKTVPCRTRYTLLTRFIHHSWLTWDGLLAERNVTSAHAESAYRALSFIGNPTAMANLYILQSRRGAASPRLLELMPDDVLRDLDIQASNESAPRDLAATNVYQAFQDAWRVRADFEAASARLDLVLAWRPHARVAVGIARALLQVRHARPLLARAWADPRAAAWAVVRRWPNAVLLALTFAAIAALVPLRIHLYNR